MDGRKTYRRNLFINIYISSENGLKINQTKKQKQNDNSTSSERKYNL